MTTQLLRLSSVRQQIGLSKPRLYALMQKGQFPKPIKIGERAVAWLQSDIEAWIAERIVASRAQ